MWSRDGCLWIGVLFVVRFFFFFFFFHLPSLPFQNTLQAGPMSRRFLFGMDENSGECLSLWRISGIDVGQL